MQYERGAEAEYDQLQHEIDVWRKNVINVGGAETELHDMTTRNAYLRTEIDRCLPRPIS